METTSWIPVIDMTQDSGSRRTTAVAAIEELIADVPQFVLNRLNFIWITEQIDEPAMDYLCRTCDFPLPTNDIYGALIADEEGRYLEIYWQALIQAQPSAWWQRHNIHDPQMLAMADRLKLVVYNLLLSLLREVMVELNHQVKAKEDEGNDWQTWASETGTADDADVPVELPELPAFKPEKHLNRLTGYRMPVNRILHFLDN
ncbi:MAG TPA: hypothetical protein PKM88_14880 [bacterium]|nr:hypothetical protein [bacterium]